MKIAISQINTYLGDTEKNINKIVNVVTLASEKMLADLVVFPELTLLGYAPYDLLDRPEIITDQKKSLKKLIKLLPKNIGVLVGGVSESQGKMYNSAFFIYNGNVEKIFNKALLNMMFFTINGTLQKVTLKMVTLSLKEKLFLFLSVKTFGAKCKKNTIVKILCST